MYSEFEYKFQCGSASQLLKTGRVVDVANPNAY
jgi:hypothetical protein